MASGIGLGSRLTGASTASGSVAEPGHAPAIRVKGLTKRFAERRTVRQALKSPFRARSLTVLDDVTLEVRRGEILGLLGPNGAGKTTLFKILATLVLPDGGHASVQGYDVVRHAARVRRVLCPVIADERSLNWRLSARQNLALFAGLHGLHGDDAAERTGVLLDAVGLTDAADRMVGTYSSGMKQRLLLARALLPRPEVLLLDEPTRSLDPVSAHGFRAFLRSEIRDALGCTMLLATHDAEEALGFCDRIAVLDRGRLLAVGTADELRERHGEARYRVTASDVVDPARIPAIAAAARLVTGSDVASGAWRRFDLEIPGGAEDCARVLDAMITSGIRVARFEKVELTLGELIQRVSKEGASQ